MAELENVKEFEQKYDAKGIKLLDFKRLMERLMDLPEMGFQKYLGIGGWDVYYVNPARPEIAQRLRLDPVHPQLTKKRRIGGSLKTRRELDIILNAKDVSSGERFITEYVSDDGYKKNFKIFKACEIYDFEEVNYVYYVVYDEELRELDRFIEVEINKDIAHTVKDPIAALAKAAKPLESLGLFPRNQLRLSLQERYQK